MTTQNYDASSIETLEFGRAIREKLGMYLSADKQEALNLSLRELIYNSQDEFEQGFGSTVSIDINTKERVITVEDDARGIPVGLRSDGVNSLTAAVLHSHSGAKHKEGVYSGAVGINGLGLKIVCHTSEWLNIEVRREGKLYTQSFRETDEGAVPTTQVVEQSGGPTTGTKITYSPSRKIYGEYWLDFDVVRETIRELSLFTKGLKFVLTIDGEKETYLSKNGLVDALNANNPIHPNIIHHTDTIDEVKVELALQWTTGPRKLRQYANNLEVRDGGAFMTGFKTALTRSFNSLSKKSFTGDAIRKYINGYVSVKVKVAQFTNQSKTALANVEARGATSKAITEALNQFFLRYPQDFDKVVALLEKEDRAEKAAEKARQAVLNTEKLIDKSRKEKAVLAGKLVDCEEHGENSILFLTEGDSAAGSIINARDSRTMAVLPLRGKIINALKADLEDVLENAEVQDIITALGCGILDKFHGNKLRYGRIGIFADSDQDGGAIVCLVLTLFYRLMPELLNMGKIHWVRSPLYTIINRNGKREYAYDNDELQEKLKTHKGDIKRAKGIGELSPIDIRNTVLDEQRSRITQLIIEDRDEAGALFELLMGEDVEPRREYIFANLDFSTIYD